MTDQQQPAAGTVQPTPGDVFHNMLAALKGDAIAAVKAPLAGFFDAVLADPTPQNVIARGAALAPQLIAAAPSLGDEAIGQIAQAGKDLLGFLN